MVLTLIISPVFADIYDNFDGFFSAYVSRGSRCCIDLNMVAYYKVIKENGNYNKIIEELMIFDPAGLAGEDEQKAFWINTYNFAAIKMIMDHYPVNSIKEIGWSLQPVWQKEIINVGGNNYSLDHIQHKILRKMNDPSIHLMISSASVSAPNVREEAYRPEKLQEQFEIQVREFLANQGKGAYIDKNKKILYLSSIFDWFKDDFKAQGGVVEFLKPHFPEEIRNFVDNNDYQVEYIEYDWTLNGV